MSDPHIDQYETLGYGSFAAEHMIARVKGLDPAFDKAIAHMAVRVTAATEAMRAALKKAGVKTATYSAAAGAEDPVAQGRAILRRAVKYAESRPGGEAIVAAILRGETLTSIQRLRPAKLLAAIDHAIEAVAQHKKDLPEHKPWTAALTEAKQALGKLDEAVRKSRVARRSMTPEVRARRAEWLKVYGAAKLLSEAVLRLHDKARLMPEVFDDLAETHRVPGVSDHTDEPEAPAPAAPT